MPVEFLGMIATREAAELHEPTVSLTGGSIDLAYVRKFAKLHEDGGFDRALVGYSSTKTHCFNVVSYVPAAREQLKFLLAHRPGFVAPTLAVRKLATLDHFSNRLVVRPHLRSRCDSFGTSRSATTRTTSINSSLIYLQQFAST